MRNFVNAICVAALTAIIAPAAMAKPNAVKTIPRANLKASRLASPNLAARKAQSGKPKPAKIAPEVGSSSGPGEASKAAMPLPKTSQKTLQRGAGKTANSGPLESRQKKRSNRKFTLRKQAKSKTPKTKNNRKAQVHTRNSTPRTAKRHANLSLVKKPRTRKGHKVKHRMPFAHS